MLLSVIVVSVEVVMLLMVVVSVEVLVSLMVTGAVGISHRAIASGDGFLKRHCCQWQC